MKEIIAVEELDFGKQEKIFIETHGKDKQFICISNILFLGCDGNYTIINLKNGEKIIDRILLKHWESLLTEYGFLRIHHNILVNGKYITAIDLKVTQKNVFSVKLCCNFRLEKQNYIKTQK